jgi:hypothetical protein
MEICSEKLIVFQEEKCVRKYFNFVLKILGALLLLAVIIFLIVLIATVVRNKAFDYAMFTLSHILVILLMLYILKQSVKVTNNNDSFFDWLVNLDGSSELLSKLFNNEPNSSDLLKNLNITYKKLLAYSKHDKINLYLLRAYFKSINNDVAFDVFAKAFIAFLFGIFATNISNGRLLEVLNIFTNSTLTEIKIDGTFRMFLQVGTLIISFIMVVAFSIKDLYSSKKRINIIQEILDVAINNIKE